MLTCVSPRTVMRVAYHLAHRLLPEHSGKFSRHDFTLAQLFACLVVREFFGLSYRRTESLVATRRCSRMLDVLAELFAEARLLTLRHKPLAIDSTCFEQRHRSAHYDRRCRHMALQPRRQARKPPGKWGQSVN